MLERAVFPAQLTWPSMYYLSGAGSSLPIGNSHFVHVPLQQLSHPLDGHTW